MVEAAGGGMLELQLAKLAETHSRNQRVKRFAEMMIKDHKEMQEELKKLARAKDITLPDSISERHEKDKQRIQKKNGPAFDEAYIDMMVEDHRKDIREFERQAKNGTNEAVKSFASDHLQILQKHLDSAISIQKAVSKNVPLTPVPPLP